MNPIHPVAVAPTPASSTPAPAAAPAKTFDRAKFDAALASYNAHSAALATAQKQHDQAKAEADSLQQQQTAAAAKAATLASQVADAHSASIDDLKTALTALNYDPTAAVSLLGAVNP